MTPIPSTTRFVKTGELSNGTPICKIYFPYNVEDVNRVRSLLDRKYHSEGRFWSSPVTLENLQNLSDWGFSIEPNLKTILERSKINLPELTPIHVPGLKGTLFPFQGTGVDWIEKKHGRALIADEMGLGKTIQALAYLQLHPELRPAIIVVPATLKLNWAKEAINWMTKPKIEILSGTTPYYTQGKIIILNYDIVSYWVECLQEIKPQVLVMDEIHSIKNNAAKRTKAVKTLAKGIPHIIGLSGTPIINRPVEAYNAISLIDPTVVTSYWSFVRRYCGAHKGRFGWEVNGATNTEELHQKLTSTIMLRRKKTDVLKDLPDKLYSFVPIALDNERDYLNAELDFIDWVRMTKGRAAAERASNAAVLAEIEGLKQLAVRGKLNQAIAWITDFLEADGKLVVFAVHKFVIDEIMNAFPGISVKIDGSVSSQERQDAVDRFQNNPNITLFVGNIQAAGVGITLTASSSVAFLELPWTPGALVQAEDRCHRIGQKDSVTIYYLLANNTIEDRIAKLLDSKRRILDAVLDGEVSEQSSLLSALMNEYQ